MHYQEWREEGEPWGVKMCATGMTTSEETDNLALLARCPFVNVK